MLGTLASTLCIEMPVKNLRKTLFQDKLHKESDELIMNDKKKE